ncbi:hypothetical protein C0993_002142 [Termitomyces sp. T159_Od127]|nr:hypothetical protein C0993_002142 [Termitomyces sp. T159_Od127]
MSFTNSSVLSSSQLKRNRPPLGPPLPKVSSDIVLQVFTHISLRRTGGSAEDDNERLIHLGRLVLDAAVTNILFNQRPMRTTQEIIVSLKNVSFLLADLHDTQSEREAALSDVHLDKWVTMYNLRQKLRCHPDVFSSLSDPKETRSIFCAYVGGVYAENGMETVQEWISHLLLGPDGLPSGSRSLGQERRQPIEPPPKKVKSEQPPPYLSAPIFFASQPPPSPSTDRQRHLPPHMHQFQQPSQHVPPPMPLPNPLAPAQPHLPFLPLFNQTAAQRRVVVEYPAAFDGPPHAVNGIQKGMGTGPSKQIAKEEAARQAYYAMGWT